MDGIQSAVDSLTSSSARLRALTVSTPSETVDVTVTGVTQGIADDVTVTGVTQGIADDETYGNPDDTYNDVDAEGLPAPPPRRGRTLDTSTDEVDEVDGDGNDRDGDGDDTDGATRCRACRGWGTKPVVPTHAQRTFQRQSIRPTLKNSLSVEPLRNLNACRGVGYIQKTHLRRASPLKQIFRRHRLINYSPPKTGNLSIGFNKINASRPRLQRLHRRTQTSSKVYRVADCRLKTDGKRGWEK